MRSRWLSTFSLIGLFLIGLGIVGLVLGSRFVFDPGQAADSQQPWYEQPVYYLVIGALMVLNGLMTPPPVVEDLKQDDPKKSESSPERRSASRESVATAAVEPSRE